jgi:hypothetical protein
MKPARLPSLFAATFLALIVVLFNYQSNHVEVGETNNTMEPVGQDRTAGLSPTATAEAKKVMANTGPVWSLAYGQPTQVVLPTPTAVSRGNIYSPAFKRFIDKVVDGQKGVVKGVYVPGILALPVIQQPKGEWAFVSEDLGYVTEFQSAARNGVTGLLAHNYLSGELFSKLVVGKEVRIVYGDETVKRYKIEGIYRFQKLTPSSPQSELIDLETNERVTTEYVFNRFYRGKHKVTFQTCLESAGLSNWGLTFTVALPIDEVEDSKMH